VDYGVVGGCWVFVHVSISIAVARNGKNYRQTHVSVERRHYHFSRPCSQKQSNGIEHLDDILRHLWDVLDCASTSDSQCGMCSVFEEGEELERLGEEDLVFEWLCGCGWTREDVSCTRTW
jgi:hypothetical protein